MLDDGLHCSTALHILQEVLDYAPTPAPPLHSRTRVRRTAAGPPVPMSTIAPLLPGPHMQDCDAYKRGFGGDATDQRFSVKKQPRRPQLGTVGSIVTTAPQMQAEAANAAG
ncbi:hypothetical protein K458DRAFT_392709 [Lentithecium fluviatile CBS 122367]|uniref:Uncharacterized protein n=1 Tax=Lentithecium fluviatile CBS 122367 TaxID=1168545 RepID=A0A6G1IQZ1_9PLEO|nr:hypothetical protein K458DRAFT_392709 [Lentithecium fluviatile CBS 122367]